MPRLLLSLLAGALTALAAAPAVPLKVSQPLERSVVQRDGSGRGRILAAAAGAEPSDQIEVRVRDRKDDRVAIDWTAPGRLELGTGWYQFEFRAKRGAIVVGQATVERVGVGEVFITCGQSNSANHGKPTQQATDERVSAHDLGTGRWQPCKDPQPGATGGGGSPWPLLGDQLAKRHDVPVGFISVGVGATAVSYWSPGGKGYARLKQALQAVGPNGARAVLWHQGESDAIAGTTAERYAQLLGAIIEQSRADAGWRIPWGVARASFHPSPQATEQRQAAIIAGQNKVIAAGPDIFAGPETDGYHTKGWLSDSVHFNQQGLTAHARGWADALAPRIPGKK
jgi:hypothetical protein